MKATEYQQVSSAEEDPATPTCNTYDEEKSSFMNLPVFRELHSPRKILLLTLFNLFLFMISMMVLVCITFTTKPVPSTLPPTIANLMEAYNIYSPAMNVLQYEHTQFKLSAPLNSSEYVGYGPSVDNAWNRISYVPDVFVDDDGMKALHKPMDSMMTDDPKTNKPGYRVGLEVFHQLHCLNLLRQATRPDVYRRLGGDLADQPEKLRGHLDHCIEILRLNLQCHSDIHAFTFHEKEGLDGPWPDYETHRVCANFEGLLSWTVDNGLPFTDA